MATSTLIVSKGARFVDRHQLDLVSLKTPSETPTWKPIPHNRLLDLVAAKLADAGFQPLKVSMALSRNDARMFSTIDLATPLWGEDVRLCVAVVNSVDRSLCMKFIAGNRVLCCSNLSLRSDLMGAAVVKKHSKRGFRSFESEMLRACSELHVFKEVEAARLARFRSTPITDDHAALYMLQAFRDNHLSHQLLRRAIQQWEQPVFAEWGGKSLYRLLNVLTFVTGDRLKSNPNAFATQSVAINALLDGKPVNGELLDVA